MAKGSKKWHGWKKLSKVMMIVAMLFIMLTMLLLMILSLEISSIPVGYDEDGYPIRQGTATPRNADELGPGMQILSWEPRVFLYHNFLSNEECEHLINHARPQMQKSEVVDPKTGKSLKSMARTSSGMFFERAQDEVIRIIEERIANLTFIPIENGEGIQVLRYDVGQKYDAHTDSFADSLNLKDGNQRIATVLMYLSNVEKGGHTNFPVVWEYMNLWSFFSGDCSKFGLSLKPRKGNAILFWNLNPDGSIDPLSLHRSCPVIKGEKWLATKWLRVQEYVP